MRFWAARNHSSKWARNRSDSKFPETIVVKIEQLTKKIIKQKYKCQEEETSNFDISNQRRRRPESLQRWRTSRNPKNIELFFRKNSSGSMNMTSKFSNRHPNGAKKLSRYRKNQNSLKSLKRIPTKAYCYKIGLSVGLLVLAQMPTIDRLKYVICQPAF